MMHPAWIISVAIIVIAIIANRSAYRNGVADGWRAHKRPHDSLWKNKVEPIIVSYWPEEYSRGLREAWAKKHIDLAHKTLDDLGVDTERVVDGVPMGAVHCRIKWLAERNTANETQEPARGGG